MNVKRSIQQLFRGWIPKEPTLPSNKLINSENQNVSKSWRRFLPLLVVSYVVLIAIQVILYLLAYISGPILFGSIIVLLLIIPLPYAIWHIQTKYRALKAIQIVNRLAFILGPALLAFPVTFIAVFFILRVERMNTLSSYVGYWPTVILLLVLPMIAGAFIGYLIGKRRNFEPYR